MTILFVDSNAALRKERAEALRGQGWTVREANGTNEAKAILKSLESMDLLITEAVFDTHHTGFDLRDAVTSRFDDVQVILTTRYDLTGYETSVGETPLLIDSPYSVEKLLARVQAVRAETGEPASDLAPPVLPPGTTLGDYQIEQRLSVERDAETYLALQMEVQRQVGLVLLLPKRVRDPEAVARFKERERLKASLNHDHIAPLYAAGEIDGHVFYTRELPRGKSIEQLLATGEFLGERAVADLIGDVAEAFAFCVKRGLHYRNMHARDVYFDDEGQASIVNLFRPPVPKKRDHKSDVRQFLRLVRGVSKDGKARGLLHALALKNLDWQGLLESVEDVRADLQDRSIMRKIEAEEGAGAGSEGKRTLAFAVFAIAAIIVAILGASLGGGESEPTLHPVHEDMILIPAGSFVYGENEKRRLPEFWINRHEISIGQYAEFLRELEDGNPRRFDHPEQPPTKKSHQPEGWDDYFAAAKSDASFNGQPISLNTPVTLVDWWDAYAYAQSKGQRLPTEEEWEKAARGTKGYIYAWGDDRRADAANLGDDYIASGENGGLSDGYNLWAPVDRETPDTSPFGVMDMTGNVQEWTASESGSAPWPSHPEFPDLRVPVVRGGHFALEMSQELLSTRFFAASPEEATLARGFRTVSDRLPGS
jgi:formylglycine-generating enzyme required for sulfatase activity/DNA-binding response OmpR family regulator